MIPIRRPPGPARCAGAWQLRPDWDSVSDEDAYRCPPCHRGEAHDWLVTAGLSISLIVAGCETAARRELAARLRLGHLADLVHVRSATDGDVVLWRELVDQERTR